jgi:uncharacterized protein
LRLIYRQLLYILKMMKIRFEWDDKKAAANLKKHHISFDLAITVFDDPSALIAEDPKHSKVENREWIIGLSDRACWLSFSLKE